MKTEGKYPSAASDIKHYFGFNFRILSVTGLGSALLDNKVIKFSHKLPTYFTNVHGAILVLYQVYFFRDVFRNDTALAAKILSQIITNVGCISKGFRMASTIVLFKNVYKKLAGVWDTQQMDKHDIRMDIFDRAEKTLFLCKIYFSMAAFCNFFYDVIPVKNFLVQYINRNSLNHTYDYSERVLLLKYPFEVTTTPAFFFLVFQEGYLLFVSSVYWVSSDTLFAQLTTHVSLQFEVLKYDIESMMSNEKLEENLKINFIAFIKRHQELLRICQRIEDIYSPVIFLTMVLSALNMCVNIFEVRETIANGDYAETGIYLTLFLNIFLQIVFYCAFAEGLTAQASSVANAIYNCKWMEKDHKFRFYVQIIIMRSQIPFYCTAYGFFPIGHKQLTSLISTSFSYYMMLEAVSR